MEQSINQYFGFVKQKMITNAEVFFSERLSEICKTKKLTSKDLALAIGVKPSTFQRYTSANSVPSAEVFLGLHYHLGINLSWFVTGEGSMFRDGEHSPQARAQTSLLLCQWIEHYASTRTKAELNWLEVEIARQYPEFNAWLIEQGHEPLAKPDWFDRFLMSPLFKALSPAARSEIAEMVEAAAQQGKKNP
ncbi:helix-turn-helix domain-containing protein [Thiothrix eikelboomii]|nr:helix-turn-helix transcriptional regulator [Thiothrix eikelboomii]